MDRILITGVSSGIGCALTKRLIADGQTVWGIARREKLLKNLKKEVNDPQKFIFSVIDMSKKNSWEILINKIRKKKFLPNIVIFNAAILEYDLDNGINVFSTRKMFEINFFSVLEGVSLLLRIAKPSTQFIVISSLSSFKGNSQEGIGYSSSKAAISIAFEALYQKFKDKLIFKTIYFGPVASGMGPFKEKFPVMSEIKAVLCIINAIKSSSILHFCPFYLFLIMKTVKFLPSDLYFGVLSLLERMHADFKK